jgi:hypothetical protein
MPIPVLVESADQGEGSEASAPADLETKLKYIDMVDPYVHLNEQELAIFERDYPKEAALLSRFAERYRREGAAAVVLRLLQRKFGEIPDAARTHIDGADSRTLLAWSERILTATTIEQVIGQEMTGKKLP